MTCCRPDYDAFFDDRMARRELEAYRRRGATGDTRRLIDALRAEGVEGMAVLDIGGGVGAIGHELLADGATRITNVGCISRLPGRCSVGGGAARLGRPR